MVYPDSPSAPRLDPYVQPWSVPKKLWANFQLEGESYRIIRCPMGFQFSCFFWLSNPAFFHQRTAPRLRFRELAWQGQRGRATVESSEVVGSPKKSMWFPNGIQWNSMGLKRTYIWNSMGFNCIDWNIDGRFSWDIHRNLPKSSFWKMAIGHPPVNAGL